MKVFEVIRQVAAEMAKSGISKDNKNQQQRYSFRGIDDVLNALAPVLSDKGLVILPRCTERTLVERQTKNGGNLFYVTVKSEFDFVAAEDGSMHTVVTYGEAMDSADKATNKAMSAAYKYACFQAFCIPTEGDNDADATTHEVAPTNPTHQGTQSGSGKQSQSTGSDIPAKDSDFATQMEGFKKSLPNFGEILGKCGWERPEDVPTEKHGFVLWNMKQGE